MWQRSFWKNLKTDIYVPLRGYNSNALPTYLMLMSTTTRRLAPWKKLFGALSVFSFILILGQMIQKYYSTLFGISSLGISAVTCFWTTLVWLLAEPPAKKKEPPSTTSSPS